MTTHDQQTLTGSHDEPETAVAGTPPASEQHQAGSVCGHNDRCGRVSTQRWGSGAVCGGFEGGTRIINRGNAVRRRRPHRNARAVGCRAGSFVDDPKECVQKADVLVSDLVEQLTNGFAQARSRLEEQWSRGEEASTEDLRLALMHYREFFERLLAV